MPSSTGGVVTSIVYVASVVNGNNVVAIVVNVIQHNVHIHRSMIGEVLLCRCKDMKEAYAYPLSESNVAA